MAMTQQVKAELATVEVTRPTTRRAEMAAMLRFSGDCTSPAGGS